jgi:metal-dependent amidase/aminoacylase/carboxypeptidase family protein
MDGLAMGEETGKPYSSKTGAAHMCGHDGHTTNLLGLATILQHNLDLIPSNCKVRLIFQPAEEKFGGAKPMIAEGALKGVDEIFAFHVFMGERLG